MYFIRILIICLIPLSVFSEVPPEYKKIISSYKVSNNSFDGFLLPSYEPPAQQ